MFAFATTHAAARVATRVTTGDRACTSSARRVAPRPVRGASHVVRAGEGNPFVEGWLDLSATVTGGGADLGVSELAENLGSVESLVTHSVTMTHADMDPAERQRVGITDGLVRLSVGLENVEDLIADLRQALDGL